MTNGNRWMRTFSLACLASACAWLGACTGTSLSTLAFNSSTPEQWQTDEVGAPSENVVWMCAGMALQKQGFPVGTGADPTTLVMTSGWKTSLAPFRGEGWREQAQIKFENVAPKRWKMQVRVARQVNMDVKHPMEAGSAEWRDEADDLEVANMIVQRVRALLEEPLEVKAPPKKHS